MKKNIHFNDLITKKPVKFEFGGQVTMPKLISGRFVTGVDEERNEVNAEVEAKEYIQFPDRTVSQVAGKRHTNGGEKMNLPEGTRILSDNLKIGKDIVKLIKETFNLTLKPEMSYAKALTEIRKQVGIENVQLELEFYLEKLRDNKEVKDENTRLVNESFIANNIYRLDDEMKQARAVENQIFDKLFAMQENSKGGVTEADMIRKPVEQPSLEEMTSEDIHLNMDPNLVRMLQEREMQALQQGTGTEPTIGGDPMAAKIAASQQDEILAQNEAQAQQEAEVRMANGGTIKIYDMGGEYFFDGDGDPSDLEKMAFMGGYYTLGGYLEDEYFGVFSSGGSIPDRYKNKGFRKVGVKKRAPEGAKHKWEVLARKKVGGKTKYKIVKGGYRGMQDFKSHKNRKRQKRFWDRMGGRNSAKAKDPFSPLYWHKRFGTWEDGGEVTLLQNAMPMYQNTKFFDFDPLYDEVLEDGQVRSTYTREIGRRSENPFSSLYDVKTLDDITVGEGGDITKEDIDENGFFEFNGTRYKVTDTDAEGNPTGYSTLGTNLGIEEQKGIFLAPRYEITDDNMSFINERAEDILAEAENAVASGTYFNPNINITGVSSAERYIDKGQIPGSITDPEQQSLATNLVLADKRAQASGNALMAELDRLAKSGAYPSLQGALGDGNFTDYVNVTMEAQSQRLGGPGTDVGVPSQSSGYAEAADARAAGIGLSSEGQAAGAITPFKEDTSCANPTVAAKRKQECADQGKGFIDYNEETGEGCECDDDDSSNELVDYKQPVDLVGAVPTIPVPFRMPPPGIQLGPFAQITSDYDMSKVTANYEPLFQSYNQATRGLSGAGSEAAQAELLGELVSKGINPESQQTRGQNIQLAEAGRNRKAQTDLAVDQFNAQQLGQYGREAVMARDNYLQGFRNFVDTRVDDARAAKAEQIALGLAMAASPNFRVDENGQIIFVDRGYDMNTDDAYAYYLKSQGYNLGEESEG